MGRLPGRAGPGIAGLIAFLRDHGGAVEADLQRYYGRDLADLTTGRLSWRKLSVYLAGLPPESATAREVGGPDLEWGLTEHLLAFIGDGIQVGNWQRAARPHSKAPAPIPRPGLATSGDRVGKTTRDPDEVRAYLARFAPKKEADDGD